jgi:hypothetical protein
VSKHSGKRKPPPALPRPLTVKATLRRRGWLKCGGGWMRRRHKSAAL